MTWRNEILDIICDENGLNPHRLVEKSLCHMPSKFYRYRSVNKNNLNALREGYEWLSIPDAYNDPLDAKMFYSPSSVIDYIVNKRLVSSLDSETYNFMKKIIGKVDITAGRLDQQLLQAEIGERGKARASIKRFQKLADEILKHLPNDLVQKLDELIRSCSLICSFSTNYHNQLMWSHYADSHKGYCLEYEQPDSTKYDHGFFVPVVYRDKPIDVTRFIRESYPDGNGSSRAFLCGATVKNLCWHYEDEWRYFRLGDMNDRKLRAFKPKRILLGCKISGDSRHELLSVCKEIGLPAFEMDWSINSFEMKIGKKFS